MKKSLLCGALVAALFSAAAGAQTCASPNTTWHPDTTGQPTLAGNNCAAETGIVSLCEAAQDGHGHAYVAQITTAAAGTYQTISVTNTGFTAYLAVVDSAAAGACNGSGDTGHCVTSGDSATPIARANVPDGGTYYLIVSNSGVDAATACGDFVLTSNGTLPVTLQNFTVS